jgi:hypothetical protein
MFVSGTSQNGFKSSFFFSRFPNSLENDYLNSALALKMNEKEKNGSRPSEDDEHFERTYSCELIPSFQAMHPFSCE